MKTNQQPISSPIKPSPVLALSQFNSGNGTKVDPYEIFTINQLKTFRSNLSAYNSFFRLSSNLTFQPSDYDDSAKGWLPIGNATNQFTGSFDGMGFTIRNLWVNRTTEDYIGLFGFNNGIIKNLRLDGIEVLVGIRGGGLVGYNEGVVSNVNTTSTVISTGESGIAGGVIGENRGNVTKLSSFATVMTTGSSGTTGGLIGRNRGKVIDSSASGSVTANYKATGGLIGENFGYVNTSYSISDVSVSGENGDAGGLVGQNSGTLHETYAISTLNVTRFGAGLAAYSSGIVSNSYAFTYTLTSLHEDGGGGGLVGINTGEIVNSSAITNISTNSPLTGGLVGQNFGTVKTSYSVSNVTTTSSGGGFIGTNSGEVYSCFALGNLRVAKGAGGLVSYNSGSLNTSYASVSIQSIDPFANIGGLVGTNVGSTFDSYYDATVSELVDFGKGTPKFTSDLKTNQELYSTWDTTNIWKLENNSYPKLVFFKLPKVTSMDNINFPIETQNSIANWVITARSGEIGLFQIKVNDILADSGTWNILPHETTTVIPFYIPANFSVPSVPSDKNYLITVIITDVVGNQVMNSITSIIEGIMTNFPTSVPTSIPVTNTSLTNVPSSSTEFSRMNTTSISQEFLNPLDILLLVSISVIVASLSISVILLRKKKLKKIS